MTLTGKVAIVTGGNHADTFSGQELLALQLSLIVVSESPTAVSPPAPDAAA